MFKNFVYIILLWNIQKLYISTKNCYVQEEDAVNGEIDDNPELRQIKLLRQVKTEKEQDSPAYKNIGYKVCITFSLMSYINNWIYNIFYSA